MSSFNWPNLVSNSSITLADGQILVGNSSNIATAVAMGGDITISDTGVTAIGAGKVTNTMLAGSIAYSKLSLTGAILNADLAGSIAYSKLNLTGAILNADLAGSIAYSKLVLTGAILNADLAGSIAYSKLVLTGAVVNADIAAAAAIAGTKISPNFGSQNIVTTGTMNSAGIVGVTDGSGATVGRVGEIISASSSGINAPTSTQFGDVTHIDVTAGSWDLSVDGEAFLNTATGLTVVGMGIGTASGNSSTGQVAGINFHNVNPPTSNYNAMVTIAKQRVDISGTTTYYLKMSAAYSGGVPQFRGEIKAERVR